MFTMLLVKDIFKPENMHSLIFKEGESTKVIIKTFADQVHLRGIFVIDNEGKFIGVITRNDILLWAKYRLGSGFNTKLHKSPTYNEINRYVLSTIAREIVHENSAKAYVKKEDNIVNALTLMLDSQLIDVPVLDEGGKIIGDLKLSEILARIIDNPDSCSV